MAQDRRFDPTADIIDIAALEHDPEKCAAVFGKDHAQTKT
jgi:hypothetical protein